MIFFFKMHIIDGVTTIIENWLIVAFDKSLVQQKTNPIEKSDNANNCIL
jgi:hypothetical protein